MRVRVELHPHGTFGRSGSNLTITIPVTFPEATLGAEIKVPSHHGLPVQPAYPRWHAQRLHLPGPRQGRPAQGWHGRRSAGDGGPGRSWHSSATRPGMRWRRTGMPLRVPDPRAEVLRQANG